MEKQIFTLKQVASSIQRAIEDRYKQAYWIQAEMFKLNYTSKGHCFPELVHKENGRVVTEMRGTIWNANFQKITKSFAEVVKEPLRDGLNLLLFARIVFHPIYGLSLEILDIDPTYSLGELQKEREETIKKLTAEGVITKNKQLDFPLIPKRLAIISQETSKGFLDFCTLIKQNSWSYKFVYKFYPAQLNGDAAISSIIYQLDEIKKELHQFDAVLIIRGGGGEIGLSCYNNYELSKAIATFPLPVVTGIGHATNVTVSEIVAYHNAITPSELADFLIRIFREFDVTLTNLSKDISAMTVALIEQNKSSLMQTINQFKYSTSTHIQHNKHTLNGLSRNMFHVCGLFFQQRKSNFFHLKSSITSSSKYALLRQAQVLNFAHENLKKQTLNRLLFANQHLMDTQTYLMQNLPKQLEKEKNHLVQLEKNLELVDPKNVLKRGYSMVLNSGTKQLVNDKNTHENDQIEIINFDSKITASVIKIMNNE